MMSFCTSDRILTLQKSAQIITMASSFGATLLSLLKSFSILKFGPSLWIFVNTLQIARIIPLITPKLNPHI